jgi:hypothetical protein
MNIQNIIDSSEDLDSLNRFFLSNKPEEYPWEEDHLIILKTYYDHPQLIPSIKGLTALIVVEKWFKKYEDGKLSKPSLRASNLPGTTPDPIIEKIIQARITTLNSEDLNKITYAHRLAMSGENILGLLLEEYLSIELSDYGWYCCWNSIVRHVDFVNIDGSLLQIKNRSNSENSSSSRVRIDQPIDKWYRVDATSGNYKWQELNDKFNTDRFSEEAFELFVRETVRSNPLSLALETFNPWSESN